MTTELSYLAWAVVLGLVHALSTGPLVIMQHGLAYGMSSRDEKRPLTGMAARIERAFSNFIQTFPLFAAAVLVAHAAGRHSALTALGAAIYFWARVAYVPCYAFGIVGVRTLVFGVSFIGILLVLTGLL